MSVKAFIDTNVFLDWLLEDRPEKPMAKLLFAAASAGYFEACISTQSIIDAAYSAHKNGICFIDFKPKIQSLRSFIKILAIDELDLCWAMEHHTGDLEDDANQRHKADERQRGTRRSSPLTLHTAPCKPSPPPPSSPPCRNNPAKAVFQAAPHP